MIDYPNKDLVIDRQLTGSYYICDPPVYNTDIDIMLLVSVDTYKKFCDDLVTDGWERGGSASVVNPDGWTSFKKKNQFGTLYNFLVIYDKEHYDKMTFATELARKLNLLQKKDRIILFESIVKNKVVDYAGDTLF